MHPLINPSVLGQNRGHSWYKPLVWSCCFHGRRKTLPLLGVTVERTADAVKGPEQRWWEMAYLVVDVWLGKWVIPQENAHGCKSSLSKKVKVHWQKVRQNVAHFNIIRAKQRNPPNFTQNTVVSAGFWDHTILWKQQSGLHNLQICSHLEWEALGPKLDLISVCNNAMP